MDVFFTLQIQFSPFGMGIILFPTKVGSSKFLHLAISRSKSTGFSLNNFFRTEMPTVICSLPYYTVIDKSGFSIFLYAK